MKKNKLLELLGLDRLIETIQGLVEVRVAIVKEEIQDKVSGTLAKILPLFMVLLAFSFVILFGSLTLSFYLSEQFDSYMYGFGIVSIGYIILSVVLYLLKDSKFMKKIFAEIISKQTKN